MGNFPEITKRKKYDMRLFYVPVIHLFKLTVFDRWHIWFANMKSKLQYRSRVAFMSVFETEHDIFSIDAACVKGIQNTFFLKMTPQICFLIAANKKVSPTLSLTKLAGSVFKTVICLRNSRL